MSNNVITYTTPEGTLGSLDFVPLPQTPEQFALCLANWPTGLEEEEEKARKAKEEEEKRKNETEEEKKKREKKEKKKEWEEYGSSKQASIFHIPCFQSNELPQEYLNSSRN